jgi:hypothetical protein
MRTVAAVCAVAFLAGCGGSKAPDAAPSGNSSQQVSRVTRPQSAPPQLPALARALVPPAARASLGSDDLAVKECGISPTYPCISTFFTLRGSGAGRIATLRAQAHRAGWRFVRSRPDGTGRSVEFTRAPDHARYVLSGGVGPGTEIVGLELYGPANVLARPSSTERSQWSGEKRRYIASADAICTRTLGRMREVADVAPAVAKAARELHTLRPPSGDSDRVKAMLRPLDTLVQAVRALKGAKGEDALGPAVALGTYATRFERAAARYGLTRCTFH